MFKRIIYGMIQRLISLFFMVGGKSKSKVFMFHQVTNNVMEWKDSEYCITADAFTFFLEKALGKYRMGRVEKLLEYANTPKAHAFITFDDAFACIYKEAVPILLEKKIPFTVFLTVDFIGREGYMTKEMIRALSKNPLCTIGAHGVTHKIFRNMSNEEAAFEMESSKITLSSITGKKINLFAFPYGSVFACSIRNISLLKKEGYKMGFSTIKAPINRRSTQNRYFIPRYNVNQKNYMRLAG